MPMSSYQYVETSDGLIHVQREGSGPPLILLHNIARSIAVFRKLIPVLAADFHVVAADIPGFGQSYRPSIPFEVSDLAPSLGELVETMANECGTGASIYGHRFGAVVAAEVAAIRPEQIRALVMSDYPYIRSEDERSDWSVKSSVETSGGPAGLPSVLSEPDGAHLVRLWHRGYQRLLWGKGGFGPMDELTQEDMDFVNSYVVDTIKAGPYGERAFAAAFKYPSGDRLPAIKVPTLVMHGTVGFEVPICQRSDEVAALIAGTEVAEVAGDAHMVYFHAQEVGDLIRNFVLRSHP